MEKQDTTESGKNAKKDDTSSNEMDFESDLEDDSNLDSNYDEEPKPAKRRKGGAKPQTCPMELRPFGKELGTILGKRGRARLRKVMYPEKRREDPHKYGVIDKGAVACRIDIAHQPIFEKAWNEGLQKLIDAAEDKSIYSLDMCRFESGVFTFYVGSDKCVPILKKMVEDFPKLWRNADLHFLKGQPLPQLRSVTILIPEIGIEMPTELILEILASQNNGLHIEQWEILGREEITEGVLFYAEIDKISTKVMNRRGGQANFLSEIANFRFGMQSIEEKGFQAGPRTEFSNNNRTISGKTPKIRHRTIAWRAPIDARTTARAAKAARRNPRII